MSVARQYVLELLDDTLVQFLARSHHDREGVAARPRPAGIDHHARIARIAWAIAHRIESRAPAPAQDFEALARLEARAHGPDYPVHVGGIDVVVDDDHKAVGVGASMALRRNQAGLLGMSAIHLLDRHRQPQAAAAGFMRPYAFDFGNA